MEIVAKVFIIAMCVLGVVFAVALIVKAVFGGNPKNSTSPFPNPDLAKTFGSMASRLQQESELHMLKNAALLIKILQIREQLLNLKERAERDNGGGTGGERWDIRRGLSDMILDKKLWDVSGKESQ